MATEMATFLRSSSQRSTRQRGSTLIEAMIAFAVLGAGVFVGARLQTQIRLDADLARDRAAAMHVGEREIERLRAYSTLPGGSGARSYADVVAAVGTADPAASARATGGSLFDVSRRVEESAFGNGRRLAVDVRWTDRRGEVRMLTLRSLIARIDPAQAGAVGLGAGALATTTRGYLGRHPAVLIGARDLGDGRSLWKPDAHGSVAFVVDNQSGDVVSRCAQVAAGASTTAREAGDAGTCTPDHRLMVSGTIRFALPDDPTSFASAPMPAAGVRLSLAGATAGAGAECSAEATKTLRRSAEGSLRIDAVATASNTTGADAAGIDTGERQIDWHCVVPLRSDASWSGRVDVVADGWSIGRAATDRHVCRYSVDLDGSGRIDANIEHPAAYAQVRTSLLAQNFVVVPGSAACPENTVLHQP